MPASCISRAAAGRNQSGLDRVRSHPVSEQTGHPIWGAYGAMNRRSGVSAERRSSWEQPATGALPGRRYEETVHGRALTAGAFQPRLPQKSVRKRDNNESASKPRMMNGTSIRFVPLGARNPGRAGFTLIE